jgi:hypothetical protein
VGLVTTLAILGAAFLLGWRLRAPGVLLVLVASVGVFLYGATTGMFTDSDNMNLWFLWLPTVPTFVIVALVGWTVRKARG